MQVVHEKLLQDNCSFPTPSTFSLISAIVGLRGPYKLQLMMRERH